MAAFLIRRLALGVVTLVGASVLVFAMTNILPGDVVTNVLLGSEASGRVPQETIDRIRHQLGTDRPLAVQYFSWIGKVGTGEMGYAYTEKSSVGNLIKRRIAPTIHIAIQAVLLSWLLGLPLGVISALRRNSVMDYISRVVSVLGLSLPYFWVALLVVWVLAVRFSWFPPLEYQPFWRNPWVSTQQTLGASASLGLVLMAYIARMSRSSLLEVLREDYVRTARAKGLKERQVITRHALTIALLPVLTISAVQLGRLLGGTVVVESIFAINGLGRMTIEAVIRRDVIIVQNAVLLLSFIFVVINILNDVVLGWLDPRIRQT